MNHHQSIVVVYTYPAVDFLVLCASLTDVKFMETFSTYT